MDRIVSWVALTIACIALWMAVRSPVAQRFIKMNTSDTDEWVLDTKTGRLCTAFAPEANEYVPKCTDLK